MAAVFPESMDRLDPDNTQGSFSIIENYIRYICERTEFAIRNVTRTAGGGATTGEVMRTLERISNDLSAVSSEVNLIKGNITALQDGVAALQDRVATLEGKIE